MYISLKDDKFLFMKQLWKTLDINYLWKKFFRVCRTPLNYLLPSSRYLCLILFVNMFNFVSRCPIERLDNNTFSGLKPNNSVWINHMPLKEPECKYHLSYFIPESFLLQIISRMFWCSKHLDASETALKHSATISFLV